MKFWLNSTKSFQLKFFWTRPSGKRNVHLQRHNWQRDGGPSMCAAASYMCEQCMGPWGWRERQWHVEELQPSKAATSPQCGSRTGAQPTCAAPQSAVASCAHSAGSSAACSNRAVRQQRCTKQQGSTAAVVRAAHEQTCDARHARVVTAHTGAVSREKCPCMVFKAWATTNLTTSEPNQQLYTLRLCLVLKIFRKYEYYYFCLYLTNIIKLWTNYTQKIRLVNSDQTVKFSFYFPLYLILHACVYRFDVTRNLKNFTNFFGTKQGLKGTSNLLKEPKHDTTI